METCYEYDYLFVTHLDQGTNLGPRFVLSMGMKSKMHCMVAWCVYTY